VTESLEAYSKAFETLKKIRTLVWKNHLGFANLDLEIGDKKLNLTVSTMHAAIIYLFQEKAEWTAAELVIRDWRCCRKLGFSNQKSQFGKILKGLRIENVGIFNGNYHC
jgi:hypothetical protein